MKNTQTKNEQSTEKKSKLPLWLGLLAEILIRMIKDSPERKKALQDLMIEQGVEFEIAKQDAKEAKQVAKHQRKLTEKQLRKKQPRKVTTLKPKKHVVKFRDKEGTWVKTYYLSHSKTHVFVTGDMAIPYGEAFDGRMRTIIYNQE